MNELSNNSILLSTLKSRINYVFLAMNLIDYSRAAAENLKIILKDFSVFTTAIYLIHNVNINGSAN